MSAVEIDKTSCYDSNTLPKGVFDKTTFVKFKISNNFKQNIDITSVADPGCLSRSPDPDFYPSRILDPKTATKERGEQKFDVKRYYFF